MRPDGSTRVYMQLANLLLTHTERHQEAYQLTRKAVKVEGDWEQTHNLMGKSLVKLNRHSEAAAAFKKAVSYGAHPPGLAYSSHTQAYGTHFYQCSWI